ncbi:50S ribosomal protein L29 [Candidatus Saccharibacteria bacterium]|nr:50S ribosomal protein L29 [Candidatus Saccharibacteria bacterium]
MADKKTTKAVEVKTVAGLQEELVKLQAEHLESQRSHKQGELVNPHVLTVQRKGIARTHGAITAALKTTTNLSTKVEEK